jgi:hypothetical protein
VEHGQPSDRRVSGALIWDRGPYSAVSAAPVPQGKESVMGLAKKAKHKAKRVKGKAKKDAGKVKHKGKKVKKAA